jgi:hypothetical protein
VAVLAAAVVILLGVAYFFLTSAFFLKSVVLPKVSAAAGAEVSVGDASISPFSQVVLRQLKVQPKGHEPILTAEEVVLRYDLKAILGGNLKVGLVSVSAPTVQVIVQPDGKSNLDPLIEASAASRTTTEAPPAKSAAPLKVALTKLAIQNATLRYVQLYAGGSRDVVELSKAGLTLENVANGQTGKLSLEADLQAQFNPPAPATNGSLQAKVAGQFSLALAEDLAPAGLQGNASFTVSQAAGMLAGLSAFRATLESDVSATEVKQLALRFHQGQTQLGQVLVRGPLDLAKTEGRLTVVVANIDRNVLNLAAAGTGLQFGPTVINSTNEVVIAKAGASLGASGRFNLSGLQTTLSGQTTPSMDFSAEYDVSVDTDAGNALLRALNLRGVQEQQVFLTGSLSSPMAFAWGKAGGTAGDAALSVVVTNFNLAPWRVLLGEVAPAGVVNAGLRLASAQSGKQLAFEVDGGVQNLTLSFGSNQMAQAFVNLRARGKAVDFDQYTLPEYRLEAGRLSQPFMTVTGGASYTASTEIAEAQLKGQLLLARLSDALAMPEAKLTSGAADFDLRVNQAKGKQTVGGTAVLKEVTGTLAGSRLDAFSVSADLGAEMTADEFQLRNLAGKVASGGRPGGDFTLSATYNFTNSNARFTARLKDFNQNALGPFLQPFLEGRQLTSLAINGEAAGEYHAVSGAQVRAGMTMTNLVVTDPKSTARPAPLEARLQLQAGWSNQVARIQQARLGLTPTPRATNEVVLSGHVDLSNTNAMTGRFLVAAESLDFTKYYDLFMGDETAAAPGGTSPAPTQPGPPAAGSPESEPIKLPVRDFVAEMNIKAFYLREVAISNLQAKATMDGGKVVIKPASLVLNGAPVNSSVALDLEVPGYKYDVTFSGERVPLAPLVNSFVPERKDQLKGTVTAAAAIAGVGTTGAQLQKTLAGSFYFDATNLDLAISTLRSPLFRTLVNVIAVVPTLVRNPRAGLGSLAGALLGSGPGGGGGGWMDELSRSPIHLIQAGGNIRSGRIDLTNALVQSAAFEAGTRGVIEIASELTNSTIRFPLRVSVERSLADRVGMIPPGTPTNAVYVRLPDYVTLVGTVGEPKTDINKLALVGTALQQLGGKIPGVDQKTGNVIQNLGGMLTGRPAGSGATNAPGATGTNAPAQAAPATPVNVIQGLSGLLGGGRPATNAPAVTNTPATNRPPAPSPLDFLRRSK